MTLAGLYCREEDDEYTDDVTCVEMLDKIPIAADVEEINFFLVFKDEFSPIEEISRVKVFLDVIRLIPSSIISERLSSLAARPLVLCFGDSPPSLSEPLRYF